MTRTKANEKPVASTERSLRFVDPVLAIVVATSNRSPRLDGLVWNMVTISSVTLNKLTSLCRKQIEKVHKHCAIITFGRLQHQRQLQITTQICTDVIITSYWWVDLKVAR